MTKTFSELKKTRQTNFEKLATKLKQLSVGAFEEDTRFWQPTVDKDGNGYAVIRFLPSAGDDELPFVMVWDHGFQGPGGWFIEKSLTTIGQPCPISEYNTVLWNRNGPGDRSFIQGADTKSGSKRRLQYYSNILVVEDSAKPENNGKVFLYRYGKKIFDKINEASNPKFPDEKPLDPFDLWEGANFKLKIRKYEGYRNYDKSEFAEPTPAIVDAKGKANDDALKELWESEHSLKEFVDPTKFKTYAELKAKLHRVLGLVGTISPITQTVEEEEKVTSSVQHAATSKNDTKEDSPPWEVDSTTDDDSELAEFQKLAS